MKTRKRFKTRISKMETHRIHFWSSGPFSFNKKKTLFAADVFKFYCAKAATTTTTENRKKKEDGNHFFVPVGSMQLIYIYIYKYIIYRYIYIYLPYHLDAGSFTDP